MTVSMATAMTQSQIIKSVLIGAALWFLAAILLRIFGPMGAFDGMGRVLLYVLIIPGSVPFVYVVRWLAGLTNDQTGLGVAIATAMAALLDGLALAWLPQLYGDELKYVAGSGAAILWGAGVIMMLGFMLNKPATQI